MPEKSEKWPECKTGQSAISWVRQNLCADTKSDMLLYSIEKEIWEIIFIYFSAPLLMPGEHNLVFSFVLNT